MVLAVVYGTVATGHAQTVLFGVDSTTHGLSILDPATAETRFIGPLDPDPCGYPAPQSVAINPMTGEMLVWNAGDCSGSTGEILSVDPSTGLAVEIADPVELYEGLAFSPDGRLFATGSPLELIELDPGTGGVIGSIATWDDMDLSWDGGSVSSDGRYFTVGSPAPGDPRQPVLVAVDLATGFVEVVGTLDLGPSVQERRVQGLAFHPTTGTLTGTTLVSVFSVEPETAEISGVLPLISANQGIDYGPSPARTIQFAGQEWDVRFGSGNPGIGCWSSDTGSVWVDAQGRLHLQARQVNGHWCQAEVIARQPATYGVHRFLLESDLAALDPRAVFGAFLFHQEPAVGGSCASTGCTLQGSTCICEIDIEVTGGFDDAPCTPPTEGIQVFFTVQPASPQSCGWVDWPLTSIESTHFFDWTQDGIDFTSAVGHCSETNCPGVVGSFSFPFPAGASNNPPQEAGLLPILNLWICDGTQCIGDGQLAAPQHIVVAAYEYQPTDQIFADGFESGDTSAWSAVVPP